MKKHQADKNGNRWFKYVKPDLPRWRLARFAATIFCAACVTFISLSPSAAAVKVAVAPPLQATSLTEQFHMGASGRIAAGEPYFLAVCELQPNGVDGETAGLVTGARHMLATEKNVPGIAAGTSAGSSSKTLAALRALPAAKTVAANGLFNLEAPERVTAGEPFVLSLSTGKEFPLIVNEDAAFFESYAGEESRLAGICTLDARGKARLQLQREKAGTYHYSVLAGPFQNEITVTVVPGAPAVIQEIQERIFLGVGRRAAVEFAAADLYGNKIDAGSIARQQLANLFNVTIIDPEQNVLPEPEANLTANAAGHFVVNFAVQKKGDYLVELSFPHEHADFARNLVPRDRTDTAHSPAPPGSASSTFVYDPDASDNTGSPVARRNRAAGVGGAAEIFARSTVCARDLGAVTAIDLTTQDGEEPFLRLGGDRRQPGRLELTAILRGENNITKIPSPAEERNIIFSTDRPDLLLIEEITGGSALLTEKGKSGQANITVTYLEEGKGLQKSLPVWIAGDAAQLALETKIQDLSARVQITLLDKEGQLAREKTKGYRLELPAGLHLTAQTEFARGRAEIAVKAEDYGSYRVGIATAEGIHHNVKIDFAEKIKPARHAVIFIGQESYIKDGKPAKMNAAPEVCFGRVFVPVDFIGALFGAAIDASPGAEKVVLQSPGPEGMKIIIDPNALQLTVVNAKDGTTMTTPIGTLFLQEKEGTYFVPAGIIARLFDAEVDYLPKRDQIEHVTFMRK